MRGDHGAATAAPTGAGAAGGATTGSGTRRGAGAGSPASVRAMHAAPSATLWAIRGASVLNRPTSRAPAGGATWTTRASWPSASAVPQGDPVVAVVKVDAFKQESVILSGTSYTCS